MMAFPVGDWEREVGDWEREMARYAISKPYLCFSLFTIISLTVETFF